MKVNIKIIIYLYTVALFLLTSLLATEVINFFKSSNFDYVSAIVDAVFICYFAFKINTLGSNSNSKKD